MLNRTPAPARSLVLLLTVATVATVTTVSTPARAQVSGSVALVSDYLYRGVSLSDGDPVAQLNLAYDSPDNWYLGAFASPIKSFAARRLYTAYAGYAWRLRSGVALDAGMTDYIYAGDALYNYHEAYVGVSLERTSARLSYSPNYTAMHVRTVYAEISHGVALTDALTGALNGTLNGFIHLGYFHPLERSPALQPRFDVRVGVTGSAGPCQWMLALDGARVAGAAPPPYDMTRRSRSGVVASVTLPF